MNRDCIAEPISYLRLERHLQGDASARERARVETHLAECSACRSCFEELRADATQLPAWSSLLANAGTRTANTGLPPLRTAPRSIQHAGWFAAFTAAAAVLIAIAYREPPVEQTGVPPARAQIKGGELALELIREHAGSAAQDPRRFRPGDRFMARVTCPGDRTLVWDLVVFADGRASFPLDTRTPLHCGNAVPLPGAFRLTTAADHVVCVSVADHALSSRSALERSGPRALPAESVCITVTPLVE